MTVYQVSGTTLQLDGDGSTNDGNIDLATTLNPITGGLGLKTVRIFNSSTSNLATVTWTPHDIEYTFNNVAWTTTSAQGANAVFNVASTYFGYEVTMVSGGEDFQFGDDITVLGTALGGTTTANDLVITVSAVEAGTGAITEFIFAGTELWPQSNISTVVIPALGEEFIQVTNVPSNGSYFTGNCADGDMYITPVTLVG